MYQIMSHDQVVILRPDKEKSVMDKRGLASASGHMASRKVGLWVGLPLKA